jgi:hypothetical protein
LCENVDGGQGSAQVYKKKKKERNVGKFRE